MVSTNTSIYVSVIISRLLRSGEARRPIGPGGRVESPEANDHERSTTHGINYKTVKRVQHRHDICKK